MSLSPAGYLLGLLPTLLRSSNVSEASRRSRAMEAQNALLSSQTMGIHELARGLDAKHTIKESHSIDATSFSNSLSKSSTSNTATTNTQLLRTKAKPRANTSFRIPLPRFFVNCAWEFATYQSDGVWTFQIRPISVRSYGSLAFDAVRSGDVVAVPKLLETKQLSIWDQEELPVRYVSPVVRNRPRHGVLEVGTSELCDISRIH